MWRIHFYKDQVWSHLSQYLNRWRQCGESWCSCFDIPLSCMLVLQAYWESHQLSYNLTYTCVVHSVQQAKLSVLAFVILVLMRINFDLMWSVVFRSNLVLNWIFKLYTYVLYPLHNYSFRVRRQRQLSSSFQIILLWEEKRSLVGRERAGHFLLQQHQFTARNIQVRRYPMA